ncbi:protein of unknown function [Vibrio tapetis subsp. tapetis]|uniref:Uncharacterized protein n=1 Tax=Vibrio tapetis subsp. tapetis TaxID=1671868 RepID=A0A2N8ZCQ3_9VIBR|nr:protein of unknown function [Vibrio tapetis subsp. tapetis]
MLCCHSYTDKDNNSGNPTLDYSQLRNFYERLTKHLKRTICP